MCGALYLASLKRRPDDWDQVASLPRSFWREEASHKVHTRLLELMTSGRSLTYKRKRAGPSTEPWGSPEVRWSSFLTCARRDLNLSLRPAFGCDLSFWRTEFWGTGLRPFSLFDGTKSLTAARNKSFQNRQSSSILLWSTIEERLIAERASRKASKSPFA